MSHIPFQNGKGIQMITRQFKTTGYFVGEPFNRDAFDNDKYYYDFGTGNKIPIKETGTKTKTPASNKAPAKTEKEEDEFLKGFNLYSDKPETSNILNSFAEIGKLTAQRQEERNERVDDFLSGFNQARDEELEEIREKASLFKSKPREPMFTIGQDGDLVSNLPLFGEGEMFELEPINRRDFTSSQKEEKPKEKNIWQKGLDHLSTALTAASFIPGLDTFTNIAQIPVDLLRGDFVGAGLDLVGVIPFVGEGADAAKTARTVDRIVDGARVAEAVDDAVDAAKMTDKISDTVKLTGDVTDTAKAVDDAADTLKVADKASDTVNTVDTIKDIFDYADDPILELTKQADSIAVSSPIEIPKRATMQPQIKKNGYYQLKYTWVTDDGIEYTSRWHTPRPNAPIEKYDTWVVERKFSNSTYDTNRKVSGKQILVGENKWVSKEDWDAARRARGRGVLTIEQEEMLNNGHWKAQK